MAGVRSKPVRPAGVAQSEARLLASGALLQQAAQGAGLLVLLTIVTILARRLSVAELGAYGLVASLAGYLLVLRNSVASSAIRAMAARGGRGAPARVLGGRRPLRPGGPGHRAADRRRRRC